MSRAPCKHGHIDGFMHIPCKDCRIEYLENELASVRATTSPPNPPLSDIEQMQHAKVDEFNDTYKTGIRPWSQRIPPNSPMEVICEAMQAELNEARALLASQPAAPAIAPARTDADWLDGLKQEVMLSNVFAYWTVTRDQLLALLDWPSGFINTKKSAATIAVQDDAVRDAALLVCPACKVDRTKERCPKSPCQFGATAQQFASAWIKTPEGQTAITKALQDSQSDIAELDRHRAVSFEELNTPIGTATQPSAAPVEDAAAWQDEPVAWAFPDGIGRLARVRDGYADSPLLTVSATETGGFTVALYTRPPVLALTDRQIDAAIDAYDAAWNPNNRGYENKAEAITAAIKAAYGGNA